MTERKPKWANRVKQESARADRLLSKCGYARGGRLTSEERNDLPTKDFAVPSRRAYPINDESHARNALARVSQHGSPKEKAQVRSAVKRKYPDIEQSK